MLRGGLVCRTYVIGQTPLFGSFTNIRRNTNANGRVFSLACPYLSCVTGRLDWWMSRVFFFVYLHALGLKSNAIFAYVMYDRKWPLFSCLELLFADDRCDARTARLPKIFRRNTRFVYFLCFDVAWKWSVYSFDCLELFSVWRFDAMTARLRNVS